MTKATRRKDWHQADIKAALAKKGYTFARIAREMEMRRNSPNNVLRKSWPRIERVVGLIIGVDPAEIWPSRYSADGSPINGCRAPLATPRHNNDLQNLIRLCGETATGIARATNLGMHTVQKTIKGQRRNPHVQEAIAAHLGRRYRRKLQAKDIFGPGNEKTLRQLLEAEIDRKAQEQRRRLTSCFITVSGNAAQGNV